jgi:hypothetical protein
MDNRYQFSFPTASPLCIEPNLTRRREETEEKTTTARRHWNRNPADVSRIALDRDRLPPSGRINIRGPKAEVSDFTVKR